MFNPKVLKTYINVDSFQSHKSLMLVHYKMCTSSQQLCNQYAGVNVIDTIYKLRRNPKREGGSSPIKH
jgi:hypothetical protein